MSTLSNYPRSSGWRDRVLALTKNASGTYMGAIGGVLGGASHGPEGVVAGAAAGNIVNEFIHGFLSPTLEGERAAFLEDLAVRLARVEQVVSDEELAAFVFGTIQEAMATASKERRELLANAAVNVAIGNGGDQAEYFRSLIGRLCVDHVRIMRFYSQPVDGRSLDPNRLIEDAARFFIAVHTGMRDKNAYVEALVQELIDLRLLSFPRTLPTVLSPDMVDNLSLTGSRLSPLGEGFVQFVATGQ